MRVRMLDKILLGLLILLLPLGLLGGKAIMESQSKQKSPDQEEVSVEDLKKILSQVQSSKSTDSPNSVQQKISVSGVSFATESGILRVGGVAPTQQLSVLVSATILPSASSEASNAAELGRGDGGGVLGRSVEVRSISVGPGGNFVYEYRPTITSGIIELRFDQDYAQATLQYDLDQMKQIY